QERKEVTAFHGEVFHSHHNFVTAFRNYCIGWEPLKTVQTVPVILYAFNRYMNFVENVLGKPGYHINYETFTPTSVSFDTSIYRLGFGSNFAPADTLTKTTMMRWGNYDTVNGAARFVASEVPSGLEQLPNPVPN